MAIPRKRPLSAPGERTSGRVPLYVARVSEGNFVNVKAAMLHFALGHEHRLTGSLSEAGRVRLGLCTRLTDGRVLCHVVYDEFPSDPDQVVLTFMTATEDGGKVAFFDDPPRYMRGSLARMGDPLAGEIQPPPAMPD
jgi:hypothetical protein